ncbi:MAG: flagellar hook-basal body complex protein FliE [Candidatus Marinimicrobia bacterium]|nr:flagellar hook-basal body complex protein FliE [Candidatus Neomarinimicrobiota bacterium]MCF7880496.1 flagellar hook-basal body complex protein FliE [Candidatus Neomarinimicrobiota bacterium]
MRNINLIYNQLNANNQIRNLERRANFDEMDQAQSQSFKNVLSDALSQVDTMQKEADEIVFDFSAGKVENVHDVMVALRKADISLKMAIEVRNRLMDGYREIMNLRF